ncbi:MAG TPA: nucleoside recognition domain-containing protein [Flavobacteriales bacterium]|nr:nucleoside recognition domain-containing protein [Flavobacteriales bacterium]
MTLNFIWLFFIVVGFLTALVNTFFLEHNVFPELVDGFFKMATTGFEVILALTGVITLWCGIMRVGEKGGAIGFISKLFSPVFGKIFPDIPKGHPAMGSMMMNFSANFLGLDNAATPLGLKAMNDLQELNPDKETISRSQIMFLLLNTAGLTLIPISIMTFRATYAAENGIANFDATDIFIPTFIATFTATLCTMVIACLVQRISLFQPALFLFIAILSAIIGTVIYVTSSMTPEALTKFSYTFSGILIFGILVGFLLMAHFQKLKVFDVFIDGAKEGFDTVLKIIPYMVAMLAAIAVFRYSGALDLVIKGVSNFVALFTSRTEFVEALPTGITRSFSAAASKGLMLDTWNSAGINSFPGKLSSVYQGSSETTFYVVAVYCGSVGIKNSRYLVGLGLLSDLIAVTAATIVAYIYFL